MAMDEVSMKQRKSNFVAGKINDGLAIYFFKEQKKNNSLLKDDTVI